MLSLESSTEADFEALVALRIAAMRESLERIGRFDLSRARARFRSSFDPKATRHILVDQARVGFVALKDQGTLMMLDHLYIHPTQQGRGIGGRVLALVFAEADARQLPIRVGALRGSDSNRFYLRHGFVQVEESEWDIYYVRRARQGS